jgi:hypothetical protein
MAERIFSINSTAVGRYNRVSNEKEEKERAGQGQKNVKKGIQCQHLHSRPVPLSRQESAEYLLSNNQLLDTRSSRVNKLKASLIPFGMVGRSPFFAT